MQTLREQEEHDYEELYADNNTIIKPETSCFLTFECTQTHADNTQEQLSDDHPILAAKTTVLYSTEAPVHQLVHAKKKNQTIIQM